VLSDLEVEYREIQGQLTYVRYPVVDAEGEWITVATTRPETILGDVGVAVHSTGPTLPTPDWKTRPDSACQPDRRHRGDEAVDPKFGTGAVKITPAHDPTDFEIAQRHDFTSHKTS